MLSVMRIHESDERLQMLQLLFTYFPDLHAYVYVSGNVSQGSVLRVKNLQDVLPKTNPVYSWN